MYQTDKSLVTNVNNKSCNLSPHKGYYHISEKVIFKLQSIFSPDNIGTYITDSKLGKNTFTTEKHCFYIGIFTLNILSNSALSQPRQKTSHMLNT